MKRAAAAWIAAALLTAPPSAGAAEEGASVDLALVLAIDASGSTEAGAFLTQIRGHAAAFRSPEVVAAIRLGLRGRIAAAVIVWSDDAVQNQCVEWTPIDSAAAAAAFADDLVAGCRFIGGGTSLAGAIRNGSSILGWLPYVADRRVIDISGNDPEPVSWLEATRSRVIDTGITVNGLVIQAPGEAGAGRAAAGLAFFRSRVIGGPGAFAMAATGDDFTAALVRKLVLEVAARSPSGR